MKRVTVNTIAKMKQNKEKITMITAYDATMARLVDKAGIDTILVGDSLGMVVQGKDSTLEVDLEHIIYHSSMVARGAKRAFIIADMPFMSYQVSRQEAHRNAGRLIREGRAHAVKLEGGRHMAKTVKAICESGIPVVGHLGLTPQSVHAFGGFHVQGRSKENSKRILEDAHILEEAGIFCLVLESIPAVLAGQITSELQIPVIGIGAGPDCDGQVLVSNDLLGMDTSFNPKFLKKYVNLEDVITAAVSDYIKDVKEVFFPDSDHSF